VGGFQLQKNSSLTNHLGWTNIPPPYTIVGQKFQTTVTPATGIQFYRLLVTP